MTLTPYPISEAARQTARASGFDIDNPAQRYSVQNHKLDLIMQARGRHHDPRAQLLKKGRAAFDRFRSKTKERT